MMISTGKILQIHRFAARALEQAPPTTSPGVVQILDWAIMRVEQNQARDDAYPCIFARGAELFYLISSIRPFRRYNQLTALCVVDWWLRRQSLGLKEVSLNDLQVMTERIRRDYRDPLLQACDCFAQEYRYWFFMHSQPNGENDAGSAGAIRSMGRTFANLSW